MSIPPLSQSRQALLACPASYVEQVIRGHHQPASSPARRGTALHKFLAEYVKHLVKVKKSSDPERAAELMVGLKPDAAELLARLVDSFEINPEAVWATEKYIRLGADFTVWDERGAPPSHYEMTLDLVELPDPVVAKIVDYKSQFHAIDADTFQARLYSLGLLILNPHIEQVEFELRFVRWGKARSVRFSRADIGKLQAEARQWRAVQIELHEAASYEAYKPEALAGPHCTYCPLLVKGCPLEDNPAREPGAALRQVMFHRQAAKLHEEIVRAHCDAHGPLRVKDGIGNEYEAGWTVSEQKKFGIECVPLIAKWDKLKKDDVMAKLSLSGLGTPLRAKKRADLADECANFASVTTKPKFRIGPAGEHDEEKEND